MLKKQPVPVAIVGAGYIAALHIQALRELPSVEISAICDVKKEKARALAQQHGIALVPDSADRIIKDHMAASVHVCVPPDQHAAAALPFLEAGLDVFLEKPMAATSGQCRQLVEAAQTHNARLAINHNFVFEPAFLTAKKLIGENRIGKVRHLALNWSVPLAQLQARQFGHWMFRDPLNLLLEQGVHPLSQICDLAGKVNGATALPTGHRKLTPEIGLYDSWNISLSCEKATAQLYYSLGREYPCRTLTIIGECGQIHLDYERNTYTCANSTRWPGFYDAYINGGQAARSLKKQRRHNLSDYVLSTLKIKPRSDTFYRSFRRSVAAFYEQAPEPNDILSGHSGAHLVAVCEQLSRQAPAMSTASERIPLKTGTAQEQCDVLIIGGTGFIGRALTKKLADGGRKVLVAARHINALAEVFYHPLVRVAEADMTDREKMLQLTAQAPMVVLLAHGGECATWEEAEQTMVAGTRNVAQACSVNKTPKIIYASTIAALYLGDKNRSITGSMAVDPQIAERSVYSRAKAECERILQEYYRENGLPVTIFRPGVVVGEGGDPWHSGIGFYNHKSHIYGWNRGQNPLPLVLVDDVADAIILAMDRDHLAGRAYNLAGDVRLNAREYVRELARACSGPVQFVPQWTFTLQAEEIIKWMVKVIFQRRKTGWPSYRELKSRGLAAPLDCSDAKRDFGWKPESDREAFVRRAIQVHRGVF